MSRPRPVYRGRWQMRWVGLLVVGLIALQPALVRADQKDPRLPALFQQLKDAKTPDDARAVELRIWEIWTLSGRDDVDKLMREGTTALTRHRLDDALADFDRVVKMAPDFAEGWNKRATVRWLMDDLAGSVRDIQRTLALEPRHFGALSGMGLIFMERGDARGALEAFEAVLRIYPLSPGVRERVDALRKLLGDRQT
jgi:tetratricopeptide (TPR) repeat protein